MSSLSNSLSSLQKTLSIKTKIMKRNLLVMLGLLVLATSGHQAYAQATARTFARLFWQDTEDQSVRWGDLQQAGGAWQLQSKKVENFPSLDVDQQSHVQMQHSDGVVLTGVHDSANGTIQSGWVAIGSGVTKEAHGDHFHLHFDQQPSVLAAVLDTEQGNPAHVYEYAGEFYLANDKLDGFTRVSPAKLKGLAQAKAPATEAAQFFSAGGGHITLAAVDQSVAYATWIDREGERMGQVDVVGLTSQNNRRYSFHLPSGGIHGATTNSGKVFFAPSDGICWVEADTQLAKKQGDVVVNHLSLGQTADGTAKRTGAFTNLGKYVLFTVGRGAGAELCYVDASSPKPAVSSLALQVAEGNSLTSPTPVLTRTGEPFVLMFEENAKGEGGEKLHVLALDPNRDGSFADATYRTSIDVGRSQIEGHSGHHEAAAIGRRFVIFTNPGDGTLSLLSTSDWKVQGTFKVGGAPTRVVVVGG